MKRRALQRLELALRHALLTRAPRLFLAICRASSAELGECGEELAARALRRAGRRILGRRVETPQGEIDVVTAHGDQLICLEVKSARVRSQSIGHGRRSGSAGILMALARCLRPVSDQRLIALLSELDPRWRPGQRFHTRRLRDQRHAGRWLAARLPGGPWRGGRVDLCEVLVTGRLGPCLLLWHEDLDTPPDTGGWTGLDP